MCRIECGIWYICPTNYGHPNKDNIDWKILHSDLPPDVDRVYWETACQCPRVFKWDISEIISEEEIVCNPTFMMIHCVDCYMKVSEDGNDEEISRMSMADEKTRDEWSDEVILWMKDHLPDFWNDVPGYYAFWWEEIPGMPPVRLIEDTEEISQVQPNYRARVSAEWQERKRLSAIPEEDEEIE